jgi:hypothetical protein
MTSPAVSVIMTVYNGAQDLPASVASVLDQTFQDLELIVIDDASPSDNSAAVIQALHRERQDPRFRFELLTQNRGLAGALNHGIGLARGRYIARQDQDDLSRPTRIEKQVAFLDAHPDHGLLGTRAEIWIEDRPTGRLHEHPLQDGDIKLALLANNPFVHSSVMIPRHVFDTVGLYSTDRARQPPEDYELWSRIARRHRVANLEEALLVYREVPKSMSRTGPNPFLDKVIAIGAENIAFANGMEAPDAACRDAVALLNAAYDRLSQGADLAQMEARITGAAKAIAKAGSGGDRSAAADRMLANLRHHHATYMAQTTVSGRVIALLRRLPIPTPVRARLRSLIR